MIKFINTVDTGRRILLHWLLCIECFALNASEILFREGHMLNNNTTSGFIILFLAITRFNSSWECVPGLQEL